MKFSLFLGCPWLTWKSLTSAHTASGEDYFYTNSTNYVQNANQIWSLFSLRVWNEHGSSYCEAKLKYDGLEIYPDQALGDLYQVNKKASLCQVDTKGSIKTKRFLKSSKCQISYWWNIIYVADLASSSSEILIKNLIYCQLISIAWASYFDEIK